MGLAKGLSRGVAREKLCESESTSCMESREGDCTKYTGCPCLGGDMGGEFTKLASESNDARILPYLDMIAKSLSP